MKKKCPTCFKEFAHGSSLSKHKKSCGVTGPLFRCPHCSKPCSRADNLKRHVEKYCKQLPPVAVSESVAEEAMVVAPSVQNLSDDQPPVAAEPVRDMEEPNTLSSQEPVSPLSGVEPMECSIPKRKLVDYESSQDSAPPSPKRYCCPHCPESFRSYAARQRHVEHDHSESLFGSQSVGDETMNDMFDAMLEQDSSDVEDYFDAEGNVLLNRVFDEEVDHLANGEYRRRANEQVGGRLPLFDFVLRTVGPRRRWLNAVRGAHFHAEVVQHHEPTNRDDIGIALAEALYRAILQELENHPRADYVNFNITANGLTHPYQSINLPVSELLARSFMIDQALRNMAGKLNSNEDMIVEDGFLIDLMFVNQQSRAGRPRKRQVGLKNLQKVFHKKRRLVKIENDDNLCVARSIVTMKAHADWKVLQEIAQKPGATADQKEESHQASPAKRGNANRERWPDNYIAMQICLKDLAVWRSGNSSRLSYPQSINSKFYAVSSLLCCCIKDRLLQNR